MTQSPAFSLQDRVVVLTGGAGLYGRGLAARLAAAGATLVLASRDKEALERVAREERDLGRDVHAFGFDQGQESSALALRDQVIARFGRIDGLVNNAVARPVKGMHSPASAWDESMKVNATGLFAVTRALAEPMTAARSGSIVNISSIQGMVGPDTSLYEGLDMGTIPDYFFHKAGLINLTKYFAAYLGPHGVRVNCLSPGGFFSGQPAEFVKRYSNATYLKRMADSDDLGGPVIFLLSDAARYVTGVNLPVDGGYTAH